MYKRIETNLEIREALKNNGMTISDLCRVMGKHRQTIQMWFCNEMKPEKKQQVLQAIEDACRD